MGSGSGCQSLDWGLRNEPNSGMDIVKSGESLSGVRSFAEGKGRHGSFEDR